MQSLEQERGQREEAEDGMMELVKSMADSVKEEILQNASERKRDEETLVQLLEEQLAMI